MSETIEQKCLAKGVKLTEQRRIIAKVMSEASDHPNVDELYKRVSKIDTKISIATVYRTVKLFEEAGILTKHDFKGGKARYELHDDHNHLIDIKTGEIIEFVLSSCFVTIVKLPIFSSPFFIKKCSKLIIGGGPRAPQAIGGPQGPPTDIT